MGEGTRARVAQDARDGGRRWEALIGGVGWGRRDTDDGRCVISFVTVQLQVFCPGIETGTTAQKRSQRIRRRKTVRGGCYVTGQILLDDYLMN